MGTRARAKATARASDLRCAYCHGETAGEPVRACPECRTVCHAACRRELGCCPTLGCRDDAALDGTPRLVRAALSLPWSSISRWFEPVTVAVLGTVAAIIVVLALQSVFGTGSVRAPDYEGRLDAVEAALDRGDVASARATLGALEGPLVHGYSRTFDGEIRVAPDGPRWRARPRYERALARCEQAEKTALIRDAFVVR